MIGIRSARAGVAAASVAALLSLAPAALASGDSNSGGVNSGGVNSGGVNSGGGGGTASGGGGGGGGSTTGSCAKISSLSNSVGYYSVWAAIWSSYSISANCRGNVSWQMSYLNNDTGQIDFTSGGSIVKGGASGTVDEDWAAFSTNYTVKLTVSDGSGNAIASQSADTLTPDAK